jgi:hypothetical protein
VQDLLVPMVEQVIVLVEAVVVQVLHHLEALEAMQDKALVFLELQEVEAVVVALLKVGLQEAQVGLEVLAISKLHLSMLMWLPSHQAQHGPLQQALHQLT